LVLLLFTSADVPLDPGDQPPQFLGEISY